MPRKSRKIFKLVERALIIAGVVAVTGLAVRAIDSQRASDVNGRSGYCPASMVLVDSPDGAFCIDKYEASPGDECLLPDPQSALETRDNLDIPSCLPASRPGRIPWRNITQSQAVLACAKAGKRLPTAKEWHLAALATPDRDSGWTRDDCQVSKNWDKQPGLTGSGQNCVSAAGAFDMIGNVWEWVDGSVEEGAYQGRILPESGYVAGLAADTLPSDIKKNSGEDVFYNDYFWVKKSGHRGLARGGYWDNGADAGQYSVYGVTDAAFSGIGVGFRCVK